MSIHLERIVADKDHLEDMVSEMARVITPPPLPLAVQTFCESINKNFAATVAKLEALADNLEIDAKNLRERAASLRDASPHVRDTVQEWITFEREAEARVKFLQTLYDKK